MNMQHRDNSDHSQGYLFPLRQVGLHYQKGIIVHHIPNIMVIISVRVAVYITKTQESRREKILQTISVNI